MNVLEVKNLTKKFGKFTAVDNISFSVKEGEILGLLGINGAGKTTTLQMLLGVMTPTSGEINYFGKDLIKHREDILEQVNFSSTYTNLPWVLNVKESLTFISYLYAIKNRKKRVEDIMQTFQLTELAKKLNSQLSAGQRTRVNLAKSMLNYPRVLLLDEPTASLDPEIAKYIRDFLLEQRAKYKMSIIITSHNMNEVEEVCDRVVFIKQGKIVADDTPLALAKTLQISQVSLVLSAGQKQLEEIVKQQKIEMTTKGIFTHLTIKENEVADFLHQIMDAGVRYSEISIDKPNLEDYFLSVATKTKEDKNNETT